MPGAVDPEPLGRSSLDVQQQGTISSQHTQTKVQVLRVTNCGAHEGGAKAAVMSTARDE